MNEETIRAIARVCHEVNRAYCAALGDDSQPPWEEAADWQQESAFGGVRFHLWGDHGPEASHENWMAQKLAEGWVYGEVKDVDAKTHHCLVPFDQLPAEHKAKDHLFSAVVREMSRFAAVRTTVPEGFSVVDVTSPGYEGWVNLFWGDPKYVLALVPPGVAVQIKAALSAQAPEEGSNG